MQQFNLTIVEGTVEETFPMAKKFEMATLKLKVGSGSVYVYTEDKIRDFCLSLKVGTAVLVTGQLDTSMIETGYPSVNAREVNVQSRKG